MVLKIEVAHGLCADCLVVFFERDGPSQQLPHLRRHRVIAQVREVVVDEVLRVCHEPGPKQETHVSCVLKVSTQYTRATWYQPAH